MGPTAPLQLEKLSSEELLRHFCETPEEMYILALWERFMDRKNRKGLYWDLRWKARGSSCPRGCNPEWLFLGSQMRAFFRFKRHIGQFAGRLDTPSFMAYKKKLVLGSIIDEYRFITGQSKKIWVRIDEKFDVVDDMGKLVRTDRAEELELWEELDRARLEDEQRIVADEEGLEGGEEIRTHPAEEPDSLPPEEVVIDQRQEVGGAEGDAGGMPQPGGPFRSRRKERLWGVLAQPLPRPDAALSAMERRLIVKLLLIDHITSPAKADSSDAIVRHYFRAWPVARMAVLKFGYAPDDTARDRQVGLDVFGIGEHHRSEFVDSAPPVILGAAATRTKNIRLTHQYYGSFNPFLARLRRILWRDVVDEVCLGYARGDTDPVRR
jgi:hypothetical protein